jgi:hypothetical protein
VICVPSGLFIFVKIPRNCQKAQSFADMFLKTKNKTLRVLAYVLDRGSAGTSYLGRDEHQK